MRRRSLELVRISTRGRHRIWVIIPVATERRLQSSHRGYGLISITCHLPEVCLVSIILEAWARAAAGHHLLCDLILQLHRRQGCGRTLNQHVLVLNHHLYKVEEHTGCRMMVGYQFRLRDRISISIHVALWERLHLPVRISKFAHLRRLQILVHHQTTDRL